MRELLEEARDVLVKVQDFGDDWDNLIARITAALAAPVGNIQEGDFTPIFVDRNGVETYGHGTYERKTVGAKQWIRVSAENVPQNVPQNVTIKGLPFATDTIDELETLSAPYPDAMEVLRQVREFNMAVETDDGIGIVWTKQDSEAAALIADYGKRLPRAMLEEIWHDGCVNGQNVPGNIPTIVEKFGYRAE